MFPGLHPPYHTDNATVLLSRSAHLDAFGLKPFIGPTATSLNQVGSIVDIIILLLTVFGSSGILLMMAIREYRTGSATVRQRLLAFLVFSDL